MDGNAQWGSSLRMPQIALRWHIVHTLSVEDARSDVELLQDDTFCKLRQTERLN